MSVDLELGPSVDEICDASRVLERFGEASFDIVVCTEVIEHVADWRDTIRNLKGVVKPGGLLVVTTRSLGFPYHAFPTDYWRYELDDMRAIFADFEIETLVSDPGPAGVFVIARKPVAPHAAVVDLARLDLYCILVGGKVGALTPAQHLTWRIEWFVRRAMARVFPARKPHWTLVT